MSIRTFIMAATALIATACTHPTTDEQKPITKPIITITNDRLTPEALWAMGRINDAQVDIETGFIAYTVSYYSVSENRSTTWIRICYHNENENENENGNEETRLQVIDEFVGSNPAWLGGGGVLAYTRGGQLYLRQHRQDIVVEGANDIEGFLLSPMRDQVVLVKTVPSKQTTAELYPDLPLASGRVVNDLMYKHWDEWVEQVPHPFVASLHIQYKNEMDIRSAQVTDLVDVLEGTTYECPMRPFGGVEQLAWNPNNEELAYTCRKKTGLDYAISTNSDIYLYNVRTRTHKNITAANLGYDTNPSYSPDGSHIAWLSMEHDGYESDENRLFIMDLASGQQTFVTNQLNSNVDTYLWKDNNTILFSAVWHGCVGVYEVALNDQTHPILQVLDGQYDYVPVAYIDNDIYYLRHSMCEANELFVNNTQLTFENKNIYDQVTMGTVEPRWQRTTDGKEMLTWIIYPPHFDPSKQYPTLLYCEGGPQSPVSQFWSFRWNFMMMAANDYIIIAPNRRGLPGFGNEWNEAISGDYGGQCMRDYLTAIDEACTLPYVDKNHLGCVGASFGGFSVYWLAGHHDKRFKAFIAHDGIFNMEAQYLETEEKWFANWDMGGAYWDKTNTIAQRTFANSPHHFVDKWDTPILCIHGEKDYRILANQGMSAFDAAIMRGIPAQLLIYPDENHWVLQPQNGVLWQRTFFAWLDKWLKE